MASTTGTSADWRAVVAGFDGREDALSTDELEHLARAHWWLGDIARASRTEELLHRRLVATGDLSGAAAAALRLAEQWGTRGDVTIGAAWLATARRLLEGVPRGRWHGYLAWLEASFAMDLEGRSPDVSTATEELHALAAEHSDDSLECFALALAGFADVRGGDLSGFASLDRAMVPVVGGHVDPLWGGDIYCSVIHLCEQLGDLTRMRSWTDALDRWAAPLSGTFMFAGITRLHQLQLLRAEGEWDRVAAELESESGALVDVHGWLAGTGFYELGEIHRLRGDDEAARTAYGRARALGTEPQPGEALLLHSSGESSAALTALRQALAEQPPLGRARLHEAAARVAAAVRDTALVDDLADEAEATARTYGTPGLVAGAAHVRALAHLAHGEWLPARARLEEALSTYREQRHRHALARGHEDLATAAACLGDERQAAAERATAAAIYERLGASADLERLAVRERPGGLTVREVEVLGCVSRGMTNREVAAHLVISEKTVSRHLESIFTKIAVTSRTAAAAWAHEHRVG